MRDTPRTRRLRSDLRAMEKLREESTVLDFQSSAGLLGGPPESYLVRFLGRGLYRGADSGDIRQREEHEVRIQLGASYPRMMPELSWRTPVFHPNISSSGVVCLGGYASHWVPSLNLDQLCSMLWDMLRYQNFDVDSPYNREAAAWVKSQPAERFPVDPRPIRDRLVGRTFPGASPVESPHMLPPASPSNPFRPDGNKVRLLDQLPVIEAELVEAQDPEILFIDE